jgi:hypothetical protein
MAAPSCLLFLARGRAGGAYSNPFLVIFLEICGLVKSLDVVGLTDVIYIFFVTVVSALEGSLPFSWEISTQSTQERWK